MSKGWTNPQPGLEAEGPSVASQVIVPFQSDSPQLPLEMQLGDQDLVAGHGEPVYFGADKHGVVSVRGVNEAYWAASYAKSHEVLFAPDERVFYQYDGQTGLYEVMSQDAIKQVISASMLEFSRANEDCATLEKLRTDRTLCAIVAQLRGIAERPNPFSTSTPVVHLKNKMLWLFFDSVVPMPFDKWPRSRNQLPISYDPEARCPRFIDELVGPAVRPGDMEVLQKMVGQCLLGRNLVQRFTVFDGLAAGGKTQLANVVRSIVGSQNSAQLRTAHLGERFETARFLGRTLLVGSDVDPDFLSQKGAEVIKALVGGDLLDAEKKGENGVFRFKGEFNVIITANARLKVRLRGDLGAWRRRMLVIRYEGEPPKRKIPNFAEQLVEDEGPGILNWGIKGLQMLLDDIAETGDIRLPREQIDRVDSLLAESDSLRIFLCGDLRQESGSDLTVNEIARAYVQFCQEKGWNPLPLSQIQRQLGDLMLKVFRATQAHDLLRCGTSVRGYRNVALLRHS